MKTKIALALTVMLASGFLLTYTFDRYFNVLVPSNARLYQMVAAFTLFTFSGGITSGLMLATAQLGRRQPLSPAMPAQPKREPQDEGITEDMREPQVFPRRSGIRRVPNSRIRQWPPVGGRR